MADLDTVGVLAEDLALAFVPLSNAFASAAAFRDFLEGFGWDFTTPPPALDSIKAPTLTVTAHVVGREVEQAEVPQLLIDLDGAIEAILDLENASGVSDEFKSTFPRELIDGLIVSHLLDFRPRIGCLLQTFGLIRLENVDETSERPAYIRRVIAFEDVDDFLSNPLDYVKERYRWGQSDFDSEALFDALNGLLLAWDLDAREEQVDAQTLAHLQAGALSPEDAFESMLRLVFIEHSLDQSLLSAGVGLYFLPETAGEKPGLAFLTSTSADFEAEVDVADNLTLAFESHADLTGGVAALVRPNQDVQVLSGLEGGSPATLGTEVRATLRLGQPETPVVLLGTPAASRFELGGISTTLGTRAHSSGGFEVFTELTLEDGRIVVKPSPGEHDSFLASLLPANGVQLDFELGVGFSSKRGLYFSGSGGFEVPLPVHLQVGPIEIIGGLLAVRFAAGGVPVDLSATIRANLSVLSVTVQDVGLTANFTFAEDRSGNLGPLSVSLDFKPPNGAGIVIDAGPVAGGGFVYFDPVARRYAGALELSVFSVSVKAFGLIDTVLPDGSDGFSFVIIIVAEFTPIQLGFGFTLVGVGGLLGIHRTVDDQALGEAVRTGSLAHLLFPVNVVANAPSIINDLAAVFPATRNHYVFGPMAKLGWGTPTLITADLGIIIEFPGPRLALLGVVRMLLPSADFAILRLNMAIAGVLDFPAGRFEINASLFDSSVAGYVVSGDMAFRMQLGERPSFLLSIGGFNPGFQAPAGFPTLRRASADLGVNGNPSLTASGYFAITSNSAQFGASIQLRASGYGIRLTGGYGFDVLFVFSPFSFTASVHAGVRVSFHGFGLGVTLHGSMSGPTPWHFKGRVCVEVAFWDACLPIDVTFGREEPAALPEMDPWLGNEDPNVDPRVQVIGLGTAVSDPRNWEGEQPADGYSVVSLAPAATLDRTPIDPVGPATLRQKVCPLNQELEKFGEYVPIVNTHFDVSAVKLAGTEVPYDLVEDEFARGQFENLSTAEKLSASSYDQMVAGVRIAPNRVTAGAAGTHTLEYETVFINPAGERVTEETSDPRFVPTRNQLLGMLKRSAAGRAGVRRSGVQKYMLTGKPKLLTLDAPTFIVVDACTHVWNTTITPVDVSQTLARAKLKAYEKENPSEGGRFAVVPFYARAA